MERLERDTVRPRQARYQAALRPDILCIIDCTWLCRMSSPIDTKEKPRLRPSAKICGRARRVRTGLEIPSCRMTIVPGTRFFWTNQRIYQTGGRRGSCG